MTLSVPTSSAADVPVASTAGVVVSGEKRTTSTPLGQRTVPPFPLPSLVKVVPEETTPVAEPLTIDPARRAKTLQELDKLRQIPALQSLARGFQQATSRDEASLDEIVAVVEKDAALCVRVLRMANSALVASEQRIEDVMTAVHMLGVRRVRTLTTALFTMRDANAVTQGFDWKHLWVHALATAAVADALAHELGLPEDPRRYLAALMHDVGKIVLSTVEPDIYRGVLVESWQGSARLPVLEEGRLGVSHAEAGEIFARENGLPAEVVEVVAHHANPAAAKQFPLLTAVVSVANFVCKSYGLGFSGARLDETDGEWSALPAWEVIATQLGRPVDLGQLEEALHAFVTELKPELQALTREI